jgi:hypothetical protein
MMADEIADEIAGKLADGNAASKKVEETIDTDKKFDFTQPDEPEKSHEPLFNKDNFRQFTDEELEKFTNFVKIEKIDTSDVKVDYLKTVLQELKNMVKDFRRADKDPLVADLMLRTLDSKINFYAVSKNVEDYNHIIRIMKDVQEELQECSEVQSHNIADDIMAELKIQGIEMKKK